MIPRNTSLVNERLDNILSAGDWIKRNTEAGATVAVSYFCFNPDIFFTWMRALEVPVPASHLDGRDYLIWWGSRSSFRKAGYALATRDDVDSLKRRTDENAPGEGTDPFTDSGFRPLQTFGTGNSMVTLFRLDYK